MPSEPMLQGTFGVTRVGLRPLVTRSGKGYFLVQAPTQKSLTSVAQFRGPLAAHGISHDSEFREFSKLINRQNEDFPSDLNRPLGLRRSSESKKRTLPASTHIYIAPDLCAF